MTIHIGLDWNMAFLVHDCCMACRVTQFFRLSLFYNSRPKFTAQNSSPKSIVDSLQILAHDIFFDQALIPQGHDRVPGLLSYGQECTVQR